MGCAGSQIDELLVDTLAIEASRLSGGFTE